MACGAHRTLRTGVAGGDDRAGGAPRGAVRAGWAEVRESSDVAVGDMGRVLRPPQSLEAWLLQLTFSSLPSSDQLSGCPLRACRLRGGGKKRAVWRWCAARGVAQRGLAVYSCLVIVCVPVSYKMDYDQGVSK